MAQKTQKTVTHIEAEKSQREKWEEAKKVKESLHYSTKDAVAASAKEGITGQFMNPFAIELGASNRQIGALSSILNLIAPFFQLASIKFLHSGVSRKKLVLVSVFLHAISLLPIIFIPFLVKTPGLAVTLLILFLAIHTIFAHFPGPAWASWIGDLVEPKNRGKFFGKRNRLAGIATLVAASLAGIVLYFFKRNDQLSSKIFYGFAIIFAAAVIFRLISFYFLSRQYEPKFFMNGQRVNLLRFVRKLRRENYGRFVLYVSLLYLFVHIAGPFFSVYMLRGLEFNYIQFTVVSVVATISSLLSMVGWGKMIDSYGNVAILRMCGFAVTILPLLWLLTTNFYFILGIQVIGGAAWAGFGLAAFTFINDLHKQEERAAAFTYFNIFNGIGIFVGALIGGFLASYKLPFFAYTFYTLFLISGIGRFLVTSWFLPRIKEVRKVDRGKVRIEIFGFSPIDNMIERVVVGIQLGSRIVRKRRWREWHKWLLPDKKKL